MTAAAATIFYRGSHRRNLPQVPSTSVLLQGFLPCGSNINNAVREPSQNSWQDKSSSLTKYVSQDGAQFHKRSKKDKGNINSNLMDYGKFFSKGSLQNKDGGYVSYSRDVNEEKDYVICAKTRDYRFYNSISTEKTYARRFNCYERTSNEMCDSLRDNLINNNTATAMTSNSEENSYYFNSGIKRNCGRMLPIPSSSIRPLSLKFPSLTKKISEKRNNCSSKDNSLSHSQARPLSIVLPTPRYNINHSTKTHLPLGDPFTTFPSPKNRPSNNSYQRLKRSPTESVHHSRKQTDILNNNSYLSTTVPSPSTSTYDFDNENNNIHTNRNSSFLNDLKSIPVPLFGNPVQKKSGLNSSNLIKAQKQHSVLSIKQNAKQNNLHYPNNPDLTSMPSTATTPSSSSSVANSSPDQPSVLLVVYPVPFVHDSNDHQKYNAGSNEERDCTLYQHPPKDLSRCGIQ